MHFFDHNGIASEISTGFSEVPEVTDPYYGSVEDFEQVLDLLHSACRQLPQHIHCKVS